MGMKSHSNPSWFSPQVKVEVLWQTSVRKADTAAVSLQVCQAATFSKHWNTGVWAFKMCFYYSVKLCAFGSVVLWGDCQCQWTREISNLLLRQYIQQFIAYLELLSLIIQTHPITACHHLLYRVRETPLIYKQSVWPKIFQASKLHLFNRCFIMPENLSSR